MQPPLGSRRGEQPRKGKTRRRKISGRGKKATGDADTIQHRLRMERELGGITRGGDIKKYITAKTY
jgi:hypothetical protein